MRLPIDRLSFAIAPVIGLITQVPTGSALVEDQSAARQDFLGLCADCHGEDARGNGPTAKNLTKVPPDLTLISKRGGGTFDHATIPCETLVGILIGGHFWHPVRHTGLCDAGDYPREPCRHASVQRIVEE